jgi:arylsulfatase A-like enzyme
VVAPGLLPEGLVVDQPVQSIDLYPTLLDLLGIAAPEGLQGRSFAPLLRGETVEPRPIFSENHEVPGSERFFIQQGTTLSVIEGRWKYVLNLKSPVNRPQPRHLLFRLDEDFGEQKDLAAEHPELVARFESMVLEQFAQNRARRAGVDVESLTEDELRDTDPETLELLKKLGYVR